MRAVPCGTKTNPIAKQRCPFLSNHCLYSRHDRDSFVCGAPMPNLILDPDELANIIAYILSLK